MSIIRNRRGDERHQNAEGLVTIAVRVYQITMYEHIRSIRNYTFSGGS